MGRALRTDVDRIVVIRPSDHGRVRTREIYRRDEDDDRDDEEIRVHLVTRDSHGRRVEVDWDRDDDRPRRRTSRLLRPVERALRNGARRQSRVANIYLDLHERSNRRKRNGWVKDLGRNVVKAYRRGLRLRFT